jgi:hypothetical protein
MSLSDFVPVFEAFWGAELTDSCTVTRFDYTSPTFDSGTGETTYPSTGVYSGPCKARPARAREEEFGEERRQKVDYDLYLPASSAELEEGDVVAISSAAEPLLTQLVVLRGLPDSYNVRRHYETEVLADD